MPGVFSSGRFQAVAQAPRATPQQSRAAALLAAKKRAAAMKRQALQKRVAPSSFQAKKRPQQQLPSKRVPLKAPVKAPVMFRAPNRLSLAMPAGKSMTQAARSGAVKPFARRPVAHKSRTSSLRPLSAQNQPRSMSTAATSPASDFSFESRPQAPSMMASSGGPAVFSSYMPDEQDQTSDDEQDQGFEEEPEEESEPSPSDDDSEPVGPDDDESSADSEPSSEGEEEEPEEEEPQADDDESDESEVGALAAVDAGTGVVLAWVLFGVTLSGAMAVGYMAGKKRA